MNLFQTGNFKLHSGQETNWKIECDVLTLNDWKTLAVIAAGRLPPFRKVAPVPKGGLLFAKYLKQYVSKDSETLLIAEDVVTTGNSVIEVRKKYMNWDGPVIGVCVFSRGPILNWIYPLFQLSEPIRKDK